MKQVSIIFQNQLFRESSILKINCEILILEDSLFFGNYKFWKIFLLKLVLFAIGRLSGVKNGKTVGMKLSTVQKDAVTGSPKDETSINYFP